MAPKRRPYQWLGPLSYSIILLVIPAFIAFVGYTERRQDQFIATRYDSLANIASQIEGRINNSFNVIKNSAQAGDGDTWKEYLEGTRKKLEQNSLGLQSQLLKLVVKPGDNRSEIVILDPNSVTPSPENVMLDPNSVIPDAKKVTLDAKSVELNTGIREKWLVTSTWLSVPVKVSDLVGTLKTGHHFSDILLIDDDGNVVYQSNPRGGMIAHFDELEPVYQPESADKARELISDTTDKIAYHFQQIEYLVFQAPMLINTDSKPKWRVLGLVERRLLSAEKSKLPTTELVAFVFLLALVILSCPFLRVNYFGPFDVVYRHDFWVQLACICIGVALISSFVLHRYDSARFFAQLDGEARSISAEIEDNFSTELSAQLELLSMAKPRLEVAYSCMSPTYEGESQLSLLREKKYAYPFYKFLYLMDKFGQQRVKWSANEKITNLGNFSDRKYFQRALKKNSADLYHVKGDEADTGFFLQVIDSRTTGEQSVVVSMPACAHLESGECAVMVSSEMRSVSSGMPFAFGFLIVGKRGEVLFQSDSDHHKQLDLFDQVRNPRALKIALEDGYGSLSVAYRGEEHRFFIRSVPVDGPDWRIVTFYNKDLYELFFIESSSVILLSWAIWFLLIIFSSGLFLLANMILGRRQMASLLDRARSRHIAILSTLVLGALLWGNNDVRLLACLPAIALCLLSIRKVIRSIHRTTARQIQRKSIYLLLLMLLLILMETVLPLWVIHRNTNGLSHNFIYNTNSEKYFQQQAGQNRRNEVWRAVYSPSKAYGDPSGSYWKNNTLFPSPRYPAVRAENIGENEICSVFKHNSWTKVAICEFMSGLPAYSDEATSIRQASHSGLLQDREMARILEHFYTQEFSILRYVILVLVLTGLLAIFIWRWSNKLLGLQVQNLVKGAALTAAESTTKIYRVVYGMAERSKKLLEELGEPGSIFILDFRKVTVLSTVTDLLTGAEEDANTIVVDHFDELIKDPELMKLRVELLEHLLYKTNASVYIITATDILAYLNQRIVAGQNVDRKIAARLAVALACFSRHFYVEKPPESAPNGSSEAVQTLFDECFHPNLQDIRDQVKSDYSFDDYQEQQVINLVLARATPLYQIMWDACSHIEKFTLIQLAYERPVNHNNWAVAQSLKQRGYLRRDPSYRIFNESFKWFIQSVAQNEDTIAWRSEMSGSWDKIKIPVLVLVICSLGFLAVTQPGFLNNLFAWIVAAGAAVPIAIKLFGSWWSTRGAGEVPSK